MRTASQPRHIHLMKTMHFHIRTLAILLGAWIICPSWGADGGPGVVLPWRMEVPASGDPAGIPLPAFATATGFGFEALDGPPAAGAAPPAGVRPQGFRFSCRVPEGNYHVTVGLRGAAGGSRVAVLAELRRLMHQPLTIAPGAVATVAMVVNVRTPTITGATQVALNQRERTSEALAWDDRLSLSFVGRSPVVTAIAIRAVDLPTVFIAGDSTVCDQPNDPYASWGQMLPCFFGPGVAIANHAESGSSSASFLAQRRIDKILSLLRPGDHLFLQFGHNDQKDQRAGAIDAFAGHLTRIVRAVGAKGGLPTLLTPMHRHRFDQGKVVDTFNGYAEQVRRVARDEAVPLVDLHAASRILHEALGPERAALLFKGGSGGGNGFDHTHHSVYGAYEIAQTIVHGLRAIRHPLVGSLAADAPVFDPAHPDEAAAIDIPAASVPSDVRPLGDDGGGRPR